MDVSRYVDTVELKFEVEFITPCFLGGADGNAEIRTAPFKNLIRRWWRIANGHLSSEELWKKEAELFGSTQKNPDIVEANRSKKSSEKQPEIFGKSKVELRINNKNVNISNSKIDIGNFETDFGSMSLCKYLGYGAVGTKNYIEPNSKICFILLCSEKNKQELINSLFLIHLFGTIGARSHNGWGSVSITPINFNFAPEDVFTKFANWNDIIKDNKQYPHLVGKDDKGVLCWKTSNCRSWSEAFSEIGTIYTNLVGAIKKNCYDLNCQKLLGFATAKERMPSHFTIKIVKTRVKNNETIATRYYGLIVHIPYIIGCDYWIPQNQMSSSKFIHNYLDKNLEGWQRNVKGGNSK